MKFTPTDGRVVLAVRPDRPQKRLVFSVDDNGKGTLARGSISVESAGISCESRFTVKLPLEAALAFADTRAPRPEGLRHRHAGAQWVRSREGDARAPTHADELLTVLGEVLGLARH